MSDLSESNSMQEETLTDDQETHSRGTMLFTMLLLTAVFAFTSFSLLNQSLAARSAENDPIVALKALADKCKTLTIPPRAQQAEADQTETEKSSPFMGIKNMVISQTVTDQIKWPKLRITGAGKKSVEGTEDFAIINGDRVYPGEYAGKVQLVEVRDYDVIVVEYKGERRTITVGLED